MITYYPLSLQSARTTYYQDFNCHGCTKLSQIAMYSHLTTGFTFYTLREREEGVQCAVRCNVQTT